jgi:hypothetical protein
MRGNAGDRSPSTWGEFRREAPELERVGRDLLLRFRGTCYLFTVSAARGPRITPVTVVVEEEAILVSIIPSTPKFRDLLEDPRYHLHALPGQAGQEFSVRGAAEPVEDRAKIRAIAGAHTRAGVVHQSTDRIFELLLGSAYYSDFRQDGGSLSAHRERWQAKQGTTMKEES